MHTITTGRLRPVFSARPLLLLMLTLAFAFSSPIGAANSTHPLITLQINTAVLKAEVADTDKARAKGLMYRQELAPDTGMLFVFDRSEPMCFWMKNTPLPLSIAFITNNGTISNIEDMQPFDTTAVCPTTPIKYALEMEQGWFEQHHIFAGDNIHKKTPLP